MRECVLQGDGLGNHEKRGYSLDVNSLFSEMMHLTLIKGSERNCTVRYLK